MTAILTIIWSIYYSELVKVCSLCDNRLPIVWTIHGFRQTIVLTIYEFLANHSKIKCKILYEQYDVILWSTIFSLVGKPGKEKEKTRASERSKRKKLGFSFYQKMQSNGITCRRLSQDSADDKKKLLTN